MAVCPVKGGGCTLELNNGGRIQKNRPKRDGLYGKVLVGLAGLEPAARGLGNLCSIRLSYRPIGS